MLRKFFRNAGLLATASIIARLRGLILLPILSRYLGTTEFGVWAQVSVIVFTLAPLVAFGSESGLIRMLPGLALDEQRRRFTAWLCFCLGGAVTAVGVLVIGRSWIAAAFFGHGGDYVRYIPVAAASLFASLAFSAGRMWFVIRNDGPVVSAAIVVQAMLSLAAVFAAVALGGDVFDVIAYGVAADLASAMALLGLIAAGDVLRRPDFRALGPIIRFGLPLLPSGYAMWGLNWLDRVFLAHYGTLADIGTYAAATSLGYAVIQLLVAPFWAMYPNAITELHNRKDAIGTDRLLHATSGAIIAATVPAIVGLWVLDRPIMALAAGPDFAAGAAVMPLIALGYLVNILASFADLSLGLAYRQHLAMMSIAIAAGANLVFNALLIPAYGIFGAGLATLLGFMVQLVCSWGFAVRAGPLWHDFRFPAKVVAASLLMAGVVRLLDPLLATGGLMPLLCLIAIGAATYGALALAFGIAPAPVSTWLQARILQCLRAR